MNFHQISVFSTEIKYLFMYHSNAPLIVKNGILQLEIKSFTFLIRIWVWPPVPGRTAVCNTNALDPLRYSTTCIMYYYCMYSS